MRRSERVMTTTKTMGNKAWKDVQSVFGLNVKGTSNLRVKTERFFIDGECVGHFACGVIYKYV